MKRLPIRVSQRFNDLSISTKLLLSGGVLFVLFAVFAASAFYSYQATIGGQDRIRLLEKSMYHLQYVLAELDKPRPLPRTASEAIQEHARQLEAALHQATAAKTHSPSPRTETELFTKWQTLAASLNSYMDAGAADSSNDLKHQPAALREQATSMLDAIFARLGMLELRNQAANQSAARVLGGIFLGLTVVMLILLYGLRRNIGARLARINATICEIESTADLSLRLKVTSRDEIGHLADLCNSLLQQTADTMEQERLAKTDQDEMIELILDVVDSASKGDLTKFLMEFHGNQSIDRLANSTRTMIENLNRLITEVRDSGYEVAQSASELVSGATQQEATTTELAATTNQISAAAAQIAATAREQVASIDNVSNFVADAARSAAQGQSGIDSMESSMNSMVGAVQLIASKLETLNEKAGSINVLISTISKVAEQTNLLSLNAAIEAEKAGEYGKGFSIVAREIRRLADQTGASMLDIERTVHEIQSSVSASAMAMEKVSKEIDRGVNNIRGVGQQLSAIADNVQAVLPGFESVQKSIHSQSEAAEQISESIRQLNESTQETAVSLRKSNLAVQRLKDTVQTMNSSVARFHIS
jgi:methyl-accepting chemotaxis protein WspA